MSRRHFLARVAAPILAAVLPVLAAGCSISVPLVVESTSTQHSPFGTMDGAQPVSVQTDDGATLRGVRIASGAPDAMLMLHLLPSRVSVEGGIDAGAWRLPLGPMLEEFRAAGFDSVVFDHRGVGASDGPAVPELFVEDGMAMWRAALELVDGDEGRIVVRAGSLGTIIASELIARGARPRATVLYAPVRSKTVAANAARHHGGFVGWLLAPFIERPRGADLVDVLPKAKGAEILVLLDGESPYLPGDEHAAIQAAAERGAHPVVVTPYGHQLLVLRAWGFEVAQTESGGLESKSGLPPIAEEVEWFRAIRAGSERPRKRSAARGPRQTACKNALD
jgi:hypothetical protein